MTFRRDNDITTQFIINKEYLECIRSFVQRKLRPKFNSLEDIEAVLLALECLYTHIKDDESDIENMVIAEDYSYGKCSACKEEVFDHQNYCPDCGRHLNWE